MSYASESDLEKAALTWFAALGYEVLDRENLDPDIVYQDRPGLDHVLLDARLRSALDRINPGLLRKYDYPPDAEKQPVALVIEQANVLGINFVEGTSEAPGDPGDSACAPVRVTTT